MCGCGCRFVSPQHSTLMLMTRRQNPSARDESPHALRVNVLYVPPTVQPYKEPMVLRACYYVSVLVAQQFTAGIISNFHVSRAAGFPRSRSPHSAIPFALDHTIGLLWELPAPTCGFYVVNRTV